MSDTEGHVDSDYSGRPLGRRPTREEIAADDEGAMESAIGGYLPDGTHIIAGPGAKWYFEHFEGKRMIWDRPVPDELLEK